MVSLTGFTLVEVLIAVGIFGSIMGAALILLNTAKNSVNISEAQLQSKEYTQMALERIVSEIRLSRPDKVCISNTIRWASEASPSGGVLNFQLPVGIYETLNLTDNSGLKWGSAATEGYFVAYYVSNSRLLRGAYSETDGSDVVPQVIAPHISSVTFSRDTPSSDLIHIEITAKSEGLYGDVAQVQGADIKLRN
jgi:prepilin-type N-terminal cleavage/methylation domain-containing protein